MKKTFLILCVLIFGILSQKVFAESSITANIDTHGKHVTVEGTIPGASGVQAVGVLIKKAETVAYINEKTVQNTEQFSFDFDMSESLPPGVYDVVIGTSADAGTYYGKLYYKLSKDKFLSADLDISMSLYTPTLSGTISCTNGKTINLSILNITDGTTVSNETITSQTGIFNLNYTLPSLVSNKEYSILISCFEEDNTLIELNCVIDSSILTTAFTTNISLGNNIQLATSVQSDTLSMLTGETTLVENKTVSFEIPNLVPNASVDISVEGYELMPDTYSDTRTFAVTQNKHLPYFIKANDILGFDNKIIVVEYPHDILHLVDACLFTSAKETAPADLKDLGIKILSVEEGCIQFELSDDFLKKYPLRMVVSGIHFIGIENGEAEIKCAVKDKEEN